MKLPWRRKLLPKGLSTGEDLYEEAHHLGVSLIDLPYAAWRGAGESRHRNPQNEREVQNRVLAARIERHNARFARVLKVGIILSLLLTVGLASWGWYRQLKRESTTLTVTASLTTSGGVASPPSPEIVP